MSLPQPAPPSLFVISLPRSLSSFTYQAARASLGLAEPVWTTDGEVLNNDRFVMGGPGNDVGKKFTRPGWNQGMTRRLHAFLDQVVQPTGFAYKDVVQPFMVAQWLTAAPRGLAVLRIRRPLVDVAFSMLARGWLYPAHRQDGRVAEEIDVALLRGLLEADAALDMVPAVQVEYDALVRDETALADALRELAPGRTPHPVRYADAGFRAVAERQLARRGNARYEALGRKLAALRAANGSAAAPYAHAFTQDAGIGKERRPAVSIVPTRSPLPKMTAPPSAARKQTVCLNMIVKDEAPVIRRCLDSVRPLIDCWVIVDTGSTDDTRELIREALADLPGELHERPWVDFAHNRSEALELARGRAEYIMVIDADEVMEIDPGFAMPVLTADVYNVLVRYGGCSYTRRQFLRDDLPWRYEGVLHEYANAPEIASEAGLPGLTLVPHHDGARARDPLTYRRDALVLEQALLREPDNARYAFYLAQSYRDANDPELALRWYRRRAAMPGWIDETWYALYQIAQIQERMQAPWPETLEAYLAAYQLLPDRAGPLYRIAVHYTGRREYHTAHLFLARALAIPEPAPTRLFVERPLYEFQIAAEYAVAAHYVGDFVGAVATANALLRGGRLPAHAVDQVIANRRFSVDALVPRSEAPPRDPERLRVVVVFHNPGPELDDCIESLLRQELAEWEACFIDDGSARDGSGRLPDDPRMTLVRYGDMRGTEARIAEQLAEAGPDLIVLPLSPRERLADAGALGRIRAAFADPGCLVAYGQFRTPAGRLGDAEPAAGEADFRARGKGLAGGSPVAVRAHAWRGSPEETWQAAGFAATRFLDAPLTVRAPSPQPRVYMREPPAPAEAQPLISCLMVTLDRLSLAKRAIRSYANQTYPNRELVIVTDGTPRFREALERHVDAAGITGVRLVYPPPGQPLGALRNVSLDEARGDIVCQWDDDDCSHPDRLRVQLEEMLAQAARASFMTDFLHLVADRTLCWVDWTLAGEGTGRLFPGSLMMFNDPRFRYPESGPYARQGEDSVLLEQIHATVPVAPLSGAGYLYLYEYHGRNTFSRAHHLQLANFRTPTSHVLANADVLRAALDYYDLARPVAVIGREGPVMAVG